MDIEVKQMPEYDVIVVGGGVAGIAAAVAASRNGAKTLLMEKTVTLGGLATIGLISWYEPLCDGRGKQMVYGIGEELIHLSIKYGLENLPAKWGGEGVNPNVSDRFSTNFSPNFFAVALIEYLEENGVKMRFDSLATYPEMEGSVCKGVIVESIGGREFFPAKVVIDATGEASICQRAGIPTVLGENFFSYVTHEMNYDEAKQLAETGDFCTARKWRWENGRNANNGLFEDLKNIKVTSADVITDYMIVGARAVLARHKQSDKNKRDILTMPTMPQFRKIRRIEGESTFMGTENDVEIPNAVGQMGDFRNKDRRFKLPYTTLYNKCVDNIYAAGRIVSAEGDGWEITRVIPVAALSGEAAGTAAALCVKAGTTAHTLDVSLLQETLKNQGVRF